jgi:hypothetical protein
MAAICGIAGSLLTRYGWVQAGHASAKDWRLPLEIPPESGIRETKEKPKAPQRKAAS